MTFGDQMQERNTEECKDRILVFRCVAVSVNTSVTQRNKGLCVVFIVNPAFRP